MARDEDLRPEELRAIARYWLDSQTVLKEKINKLPPGELARFVPPDPLPRVTPFGYLQRTQLSSVDFLALLAKVATRKDEVEESIRRLAAAAVKAAVPQASHDDPSPDTRRWYQAVGCAISEFPKTRDTAKLAREFGNHVVFGSPNVVRGGSHQKNSVRAATMIADGLCTVLTSDYYYPAMLPAAFRLAKDGVCSFADAWPLISSNPADAAGLTDRGRIALGQRADLVLVSAPAGRTPHAAASIIAGRLAYAAANSPVQI